MAGMLKERKIDSPRHASALSGTATSVRLLGDGLVGSS